MPTVRIEHGIHNFDTWKAAFDRDPAGRERSGVRRYQISRPVDDPAYIMIDLDFDSTAEAESFLERMMTVWGSPEAAPALAGRPQTRIIETVETMNL
jgi:hypothetical protein